MVKLKPMKNTIKFIYCLIIIFWGINFELQAQAPDHQTDKDLPYLKELREALFPPDEPKISAKDHPNCKEDEESSRYRDWTEIDTIIMVRLHQPDKKQVCELLLKIAETKNYSYFQPLMDIYEQHQEIFKQEWEYLLINFAPACAANQHPVTIMQGFEQTLYALELAHNKVSQDELVGLYYKTIRGFYEYLFYKIDDHYLRMAKRKEINDQINYSSPYFRDIRRYGWATYYPGFGFYTVFLDDLEEFIIKKTIALDGNSFRKLPKEDFEEFLKGQEILYHIEAMKKRGSRKFEQALEASFGEFSKSGYVVRVFEYARDNKNVSHDFINFLLYQVYNHEYFINDLQVQESFTGIMGFMLNTHTRPVIKEYLMERTEAANSDHRLLSWSYLVYFSNEPDVLQLMLDKSKQKNLSLEERKVLTNNFQRMLKAEDFPAENKKQVEKQYKKIRHETKE